LLLLTVPFIVAAIGSRPATSDTPEECIDQLYEAMKAGDVGAYLNCFSGELRQQLQATVRRQGAGSFSKYLQDTVAPVKGRASRTEYDRPDRARLQLDRVFEARMWEYQAYRLECQSGVWTIYAIDPAELHEPPIPYGTPAYPAANEPVEASAQ
jgi:hypothetical protein